MEAVVLVVASLRSADARQADRQDDDMMSVWSRTVSGLCTVSQQITHWYTCYNSQVQLAVLKVLSESV